MIFTTGHGANLSMIGALCGPDDSVLIDQDSHASIYDATKLTGAQIIAFRHNSAVDLAKKLARLRRAIRIGWWWSRVSTLSVGCRPLPEIVAACKEHGAYLLVDELTHLEYTGQGASAAARSKAS